MTPSEYYLEATQEQLTNKKTFRVLCFKMKQNCINCNNETSVDFFHTVEGTIINLRNSEKQYPQVCFEYIHNNPIKAGLVNKLEDWEFSSAREYCYNKARTMVCKKRASGFVNY